MARLQTFDTQEVLTKASKLFWKLGYNNTSINDLEKAMGISRISIYNKFGNKEGLFVTITDNYTDMAMPVIHQILQEKKLDGVVELFEMIQTPNPTLPSKILCYLIVNTTLSTQNTSEKIISRLHDFQSQVRGEILQLLLQEKQSEAEAKADLLISLLWGLVATIHNQNLPTTSNTISQTALLINSWKQ